MEIRCPNRKHGEVSDDASGELRVVCTSRFCKLLGNEIVEHIFDLAKVTENGLIVPTDTKRFKKP